MSASVPRTGEALRTARGFPLSDWWPTSIAVAAGLVAFVVGNLAEARVVAFARRGPLEFEWVSDVVLTGVVMVTTWLWLHLRVSRTRQLELERRQVALDAQMRLAGEIQRNLLPEIPASAMGFRWAARLVSAERIGGDFYDFVRLGDRALVILGDVSGKGVPAALLQSSLKTLFRLISRQTSEPALIATRMSAALHEETGGLPYATCIIARVDSRPRRLAWANAGHPAGALRNGGAWTSLPSGGPPLGLFPSARYEEGKVELTPGMLAVLVTDRITEALEGTPQSVIGAMAAPEGRSAAKRSPAHVCDYLLDLAAKAPGPAGAPGWQDDRTVLAFGVEA